MSTLKCDCMVLEEGASKVALNSFLQVRKADGGFASMEAAVDKLQKVHAFSY